MDVDKATLELIKYLDGEGKITVSARVVEELIKKHNGLALEVLTLKKQLEEKTIVWDGILKELKELILEQLKEMKDMLNNYKE